MTRTRASARAQSRGLVAALTLVAACASSSGAPRPTSVTPATALEDTPTELAIEGDGLVPRAFTDFGAAGASRLGGRFTARLGTTSLRDVHLVRPGLLAATVPAGLAPGAYDLTVVDPWAREGTLAGAFRVSSGDAPDALVASYRFAPVTAQVAGVPFDATVEALDASGAVLTSFAGAVPLSGAPPVVPDLTGDFAGGRWTGRVEVRAPAPAARLAVADAAGKTGVSAPFAVAAPPAIAIAFATPRVVIASRQCSPAIAVQLRDAEGAPALAPADLAVSLAAAPAAGVAFFADAACATPLSTLALPAATGAATFHFRSTAAAHVALAAAANGLHGATQLEVVRPAVAAALAFVGVPATLAAGSCAALSLEARDAAGNPAPVPADVAAPLSSTGAAPRFYADAACANAATSATLAAGATSTALYLRASAAGAATLLAAAPAGWQSATAGLQIVAGPAAALAFAPLPAQVDALACAAAGLDVRDAFGNAAAPAAPIALSLSATPAGLAFYADPGCAAPPPAALAAGAAHLALYVRATAAGTFHAVAAAPPLSPAAGDVTSIARPDHLAFVTAAQSLRAGACSGSTTVELRDVLDAPSTAASSVAIALGADATARVTFFADAQCRTPASSVVVAAGASRGTFSFAALSAGATTLAASAAGYSSASQLEQVSAAAPERLAFANAPLTVAAGACSAPLVLGIVDRYGNAAPAPAGTVVRLAGSPSDGLVFYADASCATPASTWALPASVALRAVHAAPLVVAASAAGYASATQTESVRAGGPTGLAFVTPPRDVEAGACSMLVAVEGRDAFGNPAAPAAAAPLALAFSPAALDAFADGACTVPLAAPAFAAQSAAAAFYVRGTVAGAVDLAASAYGGTAHQSETVHAAAVAQLAWDAVASPRPSAAPWPVALRAEDVFGNVATSFTGAATLSLSPSGALTCEAGCGAGAATFAGGVWSGAVSALGPAASLRLVATSGALTGSSALFDIAAPPARARPQARLATPGAVLVGQSVLLDASASYDYATGHAALAASFDGGAFTSAIATTTSYAAPGVYGPVVAVRNAAGDVGTATARVQVVASPAALCTVTTASALDDGATSCAGPFGADGALSLAEAVRLANASATPVTIAFAGPLTPLGTGALVFTRPATLAGTAGVTLAQPLDVRAAVTVSGVALATSAPSVVAASGALALVDVAWSGGGLTVRGAASLTRVQMTACDGACLVDDGSSALTLAFCALDGAGDGLDVVTCAPGAAALDVQSTRFSGFATALHASCDRALSVQQATFAGDAVAIAYAGGAGHVLASSVFVGSLGAPVDCGTATFATRSHHVLFGDGADGCLAGDPSVLRADPLFTYPLVGDFSLAPASLAVDSGLDLGRDYDGPGPGRFLGAAVDRGAIESW